MLWVECVAPGAEHGAFPLREARQHVDPDEAARLRRGHARTYDEMRRDDEEMV